MFNALEQRYNTDLCWKKRAMEYYIEYLQLFEKPGCMLTKQDKKKWLLKVMHEPEMSAIGMKDIRISYPRTQRILSFLIGNQQLNLILLLAKIYNKYIIYKKKKVK